MNFIKVLILLVFSSTLGFAQNLAPTPKLSYEIIKVELIDASFRFGQLEHLYKEWKQWSSEVYGDQCKVARGYQPMSSICSDYLCPEADQVTEWLVAYQTNCQETKEWLDEKLRQLEQSNSLLIKDPGRPIVSIIN